MAINPKFNADIGADISKFMRNMATVDRKIRDIASGVIIDLEMNMDNFNRAAAQTETIITELTRERTVDIDINANAREFDQTIRNVERQTNGLSRRITEARIGADIGDFERRMVDVQRALTEAGDTVTPQIELEMTRFTRDITEVQDRMREIARSTADPQVEADIAGFMAQMANVQAQLDLVTREHDVDIRVDAGRASARLAALWLQLKAFTVRDFVVDIRARWANYQAVMGALATFSRNFSEISGMVAGGLKIAISPAIVPVLASVVGLIGNLGPMLGTVAGSTFALGSAFGTAGIGAAAFGAIAVTNLKDIFGASTELKELNEKMAKADTGKERAEILKEIARVQGTLNEEQQKGLDAMNKLKDTWSGIAGSLQSKTIEIFTKALGIMSGVLVTLKPMFTTVMDAANGLIDSLGKAINAKPMQAFFDYLNTSAAPILTTITEAVGYFLQGFFNMMTAFGPLATETADGFRNMGKGFAEWADGLSKSEKFQSFVSYVSENMPKIRSIFSDAIQGMINMFGGFSGSSSDMMTSLQELMERFKKWSSTISENQGFQKFLDYFKTNGPVVVSAIGEIVKLITNFGIAAAPIGAWLLDLVLSFASWTNEMLKAHPWLGKLAAGAVVVVGSLMAITAPILLVNALFGGMVIAIVKTVAKMIWGATVFIAKWTLIGVQATFNALRVAAAWTIATGVKMVVAVAKMIASAVIFIARWTLMGVQALLHAAKVAAAWALATGVKMVVAVAKMIATATIFVAKWLLIGTQALLHAAKVGAAWALTTGVAMVVAVAKMAATAAVFVAKWVWMGVQSLLAAARMAAAWFIALGPIGWVAGAIIALVALVILNWDKVSAWTSKAWSATAKFVTDAVSKIAGWIQQKFPALYNVIASYMNMAKSIISAVWSAIKGTFSNVLAFLKALVKGDFQGMKTAIQNQMELAKSTIQRIWGAVKSYLSTLLGTLVSKFQEMFGKMVSKIREKMAEAVRVLGQKVGEMPGKVIGFVGEMLSAGGQLVTGLINGIKNMGGAAIEAISGVVGGVIGKAKSLLKIKSPSRVFAEMGAYVSEGLANGVSDKAKLAVNNVSRMATAMSGAFNPAFAMADMRASAQLDTSINRSDMGVVKKSFAAEVGELERHEPDLYLVVDGKELGKVVARPVQEENDRRGAMLKVGRGR